MSHQPPTGILPCMQPGQESISAWRDSAPFWEKHREIIRQMFAPVTQALVEDGLIGTRHAVLDVATGPGEPALDIAAVVGPEGKVIGSIRFQRWSQPLGGRQTMVVSRIRNLTSPL